MLSVCASPRSTRIWSRRGVASSGCCLLIWRSSGLPWRTVESIVKRSSSRRCAALLRASALLGKGGKLSPTREREQRSFSAPENRRLQELVAAFVAEKGESEPKRWAAWSANSFTDRGASSLREQARRLGAGVYSRKHQCAYGRDGNGDRCGSVRGEAGCSFCKVPDDSGVRRAMGLKGPFQSSLLCCSLQRPRPEDGSQHAEPAGARCAAGARSERLPGAAAPGGPWWRERGAARGHRAAPLHRSTARRRRPARDTAAGGVWGELSPSPP